VISELNLDEPKDDREHKLTSLLDTDSLILDKSPKLRHGLISLYSFYRSEIFHKKFSSLLAASFIYKNFVYIIDFMTFIMLSLEYGPT